MPSPAPRRQPLLSPRVLKPAAIAFGIGLLLFLLVWLNSRRQYDFYKADGSQAAPGQTDALPAPLPPDVAGGDNASGLRVVGKGSVTDEAAVPAAGRPRIIETPARPAAPPSPTAVPGTTTAGDLAMPEPLSTPAPRYPPEALRMRAGGTVRVRVTVAIDGSVDRLELAEGSGNRHLDRAALEAVRRWHFRPATRNGQPAAAEVVVPIEFNPNGK